MDTFEEINVKGFADEFIDPSLDLFDEIEKLKKEKTCSTAGVEVEACLNLLTPKFYIFWL